MTPIPHEDRPSPPPLVVIGASTGGTRAIARILELLPPLRACILVVQHMPLFINESFCRSLAGLSANPVQLARDGDLLAEGLVLVAPSGVHCRLIGNRRIHLLPGPPVQYVCPSIDVTMQSVQPHPLPRPLVGILLTGMGRDGAEGMAHLKRIGATTIAQDEATCAVHGMPAEAVRLGCVDYELNPDAIARSLAAAPALARPGPRRA